MNLNKIFPRLSIRTKLGIAFVAWTVLPLSVVAAISVPLAMRQFRTVAEVGLERDVELIQRQIGNAIREAEQHLHFLTQTVIIDILNRAEPADGAFTAWAGEFLEKDSSAVIRVKAIDAEGNAVFSTDAESSAQTGSRGEFFYLWMAEEARPNTTIMTPIEIRGPSDTDNGVVPAIAIIRSIHSPDGRFLGAAIAEASAARLLSAIEMSDSAGIQGLTDLEGRYVYHSERKRDWASLLATRGEVSVHSDFPAPVAARILSGERGTVASDRETLVAYQPVRIDAGRTLPLVMYRAVPMAVVWSSARTLLITLVTIGGAGMLIGIGAAVVAADQLTKPIYRLQYAFRALTSGAAVGPLEIATNDELEDLSDDFATMATTLAEQKEGLEAVIEGHSRALEISNMLAASLAHEFNNPIAILTNRIELMQRDAANSGAPQFERDLQVLQENLDRLRLISTDLVAFAKGDSTKAELVDLGTLVRRVARLLDQSFATKSVALTLHIPERVPLIHGNQQALETVVVNLLTNALNHTPARGRVDVTVRGAADDKSTEIIVSDTGSGIPAAVRDRIFRPFFTTRRNDGGTGLGLTVSKTVVDRHGGTLTYESGTSGGSRFIARLPCLTSTASAP